jgi:hypothetical protein
MPTRYYFDRRQTPTTYPNGARVFRTPFPFASIARVENCPCEDGVRRTVDATGEGKHVSGFVTFDDDSPRFLAYTYRRNAHLIERK